MNYKTFIQEATTSEGSFIYRIIPEEETKTSSECFYFKDIPEGSYTILISTDKLYCTPRTFKSFHENLFRAIPFKILGSFETLIKTAGIIPLTGIKLSKESEKFSINPVYRTAIPEHYKNNFGTTSSKKIEYNSFWDNFFDSKFIYQFKKELSEINPPRKRA